MNFSLAFLRATCFWRAQSRVFVNGQTEVISNGLLSPARNWRRHRAVKAFFLSPSFFLSAPDELHFRSQRAASHWQTRRGRRSGPAEGSGKRKRMKESFSGAHGSQKLGSRARWLESKIIAPLNNNHGASCEMQISWRR